MPFATKSSLRKLELFAWRASFGTSGVVGDTGSMLKISMYRRTLGIVSTETAYDAPGRIV